MRFEWAHASSGPQLVDPDELAGYDEEGNPDRDHGLWMGDEVMIYGSLDDLHALGVRISLLVERTREG